MCLMEGQRSRRARLEEKVGVCVPGDRRSHVRRERSSSRESDFVFDVTVSALDSVSGRECPAPRPPFFNALTFPFVIHFTSLDVSTGTASLESLE